MRLPYLEFANVVARARRETLREHPDYPDIPVVPLSTEASVIDGELYVPFWGEFEVPATIILYQAAYETMPDKENYYRQIKAVLRHEYEHAMGESHGEGAVIPRVRVA